MPLDIDALYTCPVCGETNAIGIEMSGGSRQRLIEDCPVCCRPLVFAIEIDRDGDATIASVELE
jgi:Cysteine-rich CPXCG